MIYTTKTLCENIALLRKNNGLSKSEMSKMLGISVYSLNIIEQGKVPPRLDIHIFYNLYTSFGITPSEIFIDNSQNMLSVVRMS